MNNTEQARALDAGLAEAPSTRREALRKLGKLGLGAAAASISVFGAGPRRALAQDGPTAVLNFALTLEYLESVYYNQGLATSGLIPSEGQAVYELISDHEDAHVAALVSTINSQGGTPVGPFDESDFDFTAGGTFPDPFSDYPVFLALSQAFEDTGVRAYKGQAGAVVGGGPLLTAALQIHSVEARHAAEVRRIRASMGADLQPWITGNELGGIPAAASASYAGEENTMQAGIDITGLGNGYSAEAASEAFDEPLTMEAVLDIADLFVVGDLDGDGDDNG